jgi:hypothetical protein
MTSDATQFVNKPQINRHYSLFCSYEIIVCTHVSVKPFTYWGSVVCGLQTAFEVGVTNQFAADLFRNEFAVSVRTLSARAHGHLFSPSWNVCICVCSINVCRSVFANSFLSHRLCFPTTPPHVNLSVYLPLYPVSLSTIFVFQSIPCWLLFNVFVLLHLWSCL